MRIYSNLIVSVLILLQIGRTSGSEEFETNPEETATEEVAEAKPHRARTWHIQNYPHILSARDECGVHAPAERLCDPDNVLETAESQAKVEDALVQTVQFTIECNGKEVKTESKVAVALVNQMDLPAFGAEDDNEKTREKVAEIFARITHNQWGVGDELECGGTGVVIFISVTDRAMFISKGKALDPILTDRRLDNILESMKPALRKNMYQEATLRAIKKIHSLLEDGEPKFSEKALIWMERVLPFLLFTCALFFAYLTSRKHRDEQRRYTLVASQLNALDHARAEALQGRFQCVSCPICLEPFKEEKEEDKDKRFGSDGAPLKLLRCGHAFDESCWTEWVNNGQGNVGQCPVCKAAVRGKEDKADEREDAASTEETEDTAVATPSTNRRAVLRRYNLDRNYRLAVLHQRFPEYLRQQEIDTWTANTFEGSMASDDNFRQRNPNRHDRPRPDKNEDFGSLVGGGTSGGGRGSLW